MAKKYQELERFLNSVRFRKQILGGVNEEDVWHVFERLHNEYDELMEVQHQHTAGAVSEWKNYALQLQDMIRENDEEVKRLRSEWNQLKSVMLQQPPQPKPQVKSQEKVLWQEEILGQRQSPDQEHIQFGDFDAVKPPRAFSANQLLKIYSKDASSK
jgi:hypothetical protein